MDIDEQENCGEPPCKIPHLINNTGDAGATGHTYSLRNDTGIINNLKAELNSKSNETNHALNSKFQSDIVDKRHDHIWSQEDKANSFDKTSNTWQIDFNAKNADNSNIVVTNNQYNNKFQSPQINAESSQLFPPELEVEVNVSLSDAKFSPSESEMFELVSSTITSTTSNNLNNFKNNVAKKRFKTMSSSSHNLPKANLSEIYAEFMLSYHKKVCAVKDLMITTMAELSCEDKTNFPKQNLLIDIESLMVKKSQYDNIVGIKEISPTDYTDLKITGLFGRHYRFCCLSFPFQYSTNYSKMCDINVVACDNCVCYACNLPVKECLLWLASDIGHANANPHDIYWEIKKLVYRKLGYPVGREHDVYTSPFLRSLEEVNITDSMRQAEMVFLKRQCELNFVYYIYAFCNVHQKMTNTKELNTESADEDDDKADGIKNSTSPKATRSYVGVMEIMTDLLDQSKAIFFNNNSNFSAAVVLLDLIIHTIATHECSYLDDGMFEKLIKSFLEDLEKFCVLMFLQKELDCAWTSEYLKSCLISFSEIFKDHTFDVFFNLVSWRSDTMTAWLSSNKGDVAENSAVEHFFIVQERIKLLQGIQLANYIKQVQIKPCIEAALFLFEHNRHQDARRCFFQLDQISDEKVLIFKGILSANGCSFECGRSLFIILLRHIGLKYRKSKLGGKSDECNLFDASKILESPIANIVIEMIRSNKKNGQCVAVQENLLVNIAKLIHDSGEPNASQPGIPEQASNLILCVGLLLSLIFETPKSQEVGLPLLLENFLDNSERQSIMTYTFARMAQHFKFSEDAVEKIANWLSRDYIPNNGLGSLDLQGLQTFLFRAATSSHNSVKIVTDVMTSFYNYFSNERMDIKSRIGAEANFLQTGLRLIDFMLGSSVDKNGNVDALCELLSVVVGTETNYCNPLKQELALGVARYKLCSTGDECWMKRILELCPGKQIDEIDFDLCATMAAKIDGNKKLCSLLQLIVQRGGCCYANDLLSKYGVSKKIGVKIFKPTTIKAIIKLLTSTTIVPSVKTKFIHNIKELLAHHYVELYESSFLEAGSDLAEWTEKLIRIMADSDPTFSVQMAVLVWEEIENHFGNTVVYPPSAVSFISWLKIVKDVFKLAGQSFDFAERLKNFQRGKLGRRKHVKQVLIDALPMLTQDLPTVETPHKSPTTPGSEQKEAINSGIKDKSITKPTIPKSEQQSAGVNITTTDIKPSGVHQGAGLQVYYCGQPIEELMLTSSPGWYAFRLPSFAGQSQGSYPNFMGLPGAAAAISMGQFASPAVNMYNIHPGQQQQQMVLDHSKFYQQQQRAVYHNNMLQPSAWNSTVASNNMNNSFCSPVAAISTANDNAMVDNNSANQLLSASMPKNV